ncbi:MAG: SulP family inorganic anion transporter [Aphanocapsa feldmannii 277cV]|uniref:SulP family inorganic anion transporter n=2 Tax=Aphanocapsa feldmannii TaxID=192050 RepID=A0A524RKH5_9CHRO|nr:MAG: SulP family inorganic anion transporter [Aphanocapsa feldmannii 277cV]TGH23929.1 MAG: SulP family inorganic anion transporter [Aphanocapsa feldmannii 277cI]
MVSFKPVHGLHFRNVKGDFFGGITAAVVALPLALAFGNAALGEGGAIYGLYGAVIVGFFAALFGGTPSQVSGPTGPMSVTVAGVMASLAAVGVNQSLASGEALPLVMAAVVVGGLFQILFGVLRLGRYVTLVPYSVISGFMSGIGVIILLIQVGPFLGISTKGGVVDSLSMLFANFTPNWAAAGIGVMTLGIVFLTPKRISRAVPSPLLALLIVTPISVLAFGQGDIIPRVGDIPEGGLQFSMPNFGNHLPTVIQAGLVLAVLGAIDSLLTSLVADNITQTRHDSERELIGQGIGNTVAGLFNGLPGAGATMRTVINVKSGGSTPLSGMVHSAALLVVLLGAGPLAARIPNALLAGILIKVGLDIIDWGFLLRAHRLSSKTAVLMYGVLLMTVFWNLIWAVLVGVFVANMLTIEGLTETQLEGMEEANAPEGDHELPWEDRVLLDQCRGKAMLFRLSGPMSFGAAKGITERLALVENYTSLILDVSEVPRIGVTAALALENIVQAAHAKGRRIFLVGASGRVRQRLERLGMEDLLDGGFDTSRHEALETVAPGNVAPSNKE